MFGIKSTRGMIASQCILTLAWMCFEQATFAIDVAANAPDTIFVNGTIVTLTQPDEVAEALAVKDGIIVRVGSNASLRSLATPTTTIVDLEQKVVVPGFYAAHDHFPSVGRVALFDVDLNSPPIGAMNSIDDIVLALQARARSTPPGEWIVGRGYDDTLIQEKRHPNRIDLDRASTKHPIWIVHTSGHLGVANSMALQIAKVTRETPQPSGGVIRKDPISGEPDGVFEEKLTIISGKTPFLNSEQRLEAIRYCDRLYLSKGVTTTVIAGGMGSVFSELLEAKKRDWLHLRVIGMSSGNQSSPPSPKTLAQQSPDPDFIRYGAVKLSQDGSLQGYTGFLSNPYHEQPQGKNDYRGYAARPRDRLVEIVDQYHRAGYQIAIHGNGDAAIDDILFAYQQAQQNFPRQDTRHRIEHCQTPRDDQLEFMRELGVTPSFFIAHVYYWGDRHRDLFLGPDRASRISPLKSSLDHQLTFSLHNDTPVTPVDPLHLVWCAVQRQTRNGKTLGANERISAYQAMRAITIDAAWQNFDENSKGTIESGKLADLVVLDKNPLSVDPQELRKISILETFVAGQSVYRRQATSQ